MKNPNFFKPLLIKANKYVALFSFFLLNAFLVNAQLKADFNVNSNAGCAPLVVKFNDISTGNATAWLWDLGNGTTSSLKDPSVAYFEPGTYSVSLTIRNSFGVDSITKAQYITVYSSPTINFSASNQTGCFPLSTQFTDLSLSGSGSLNKWEWDFGDGNFSDVQNPQHTYNSVGSFNVSLRATNNFGCVTSKTLPSFITITTGVKADFSNSTSKTCNAPATINFKNNSTGVGTLNYQWDFGDGATSTETNPFHTYTSSGSYTVGLIVSNSTGCTDTLIKQHLITIGTTTTDFSVPSLVCEGSPVRFKNESNPVPASASWDFGDDTFSDSINPIKAFKKAGDYLVTLVSNNGACKDSITKTVKIIAKPRVSFTVPASVSCEAPFKVDFINSSSGTEARLSENRPTYYWDFGDGITSDLKNPSHTYLKEGDFTVKLIVTNAAGCKDSLVQKNFIRIKKPVASINNLPQKGCAPLSHKFTATINSIDSIASYHWDFGDGNSSDFITPTHVYNTPGKYSVTLTYTTAGGCTNSVKVVDGIWVGSKPQASFVAGPLDVCAFQEIHFVDQTTGNPNEWVWFFGDGSSSTTQNPVHQYNDTGYFSVTLIAFNNGCADTITHHDKIHIKPPVALFSFKQTCTVPRQVIFTDQSLGADSWSWDFGDGSTSNEKSPVHDYITPGNYKVSLTVSNQSTGCSQTKNTTVKIIREIADFTISNEEICRNAPVIFMAGNTNPANISSYTWKFGDGISTSTKLNSITHQYAKASAYDVTLIAFNNGCADTIT
ncbi:MAG TPA: PKD domain-containing protein, partial [Hanamia sp.]|nr:PKD domain-containing protein [Hanamia sp.]